MRPATIILAIATVCVAIGNGYAQTNGLFVNHPYRAYLFWSLAGIFFVLAIWSFINESKPVSFKVTLRELHRKEIDFKGTYPGAEWKYDIFLRARIELLEEAKSAKVNYRLELWMSGIPEVPELKNDIADWQLVIFEPISG